ncbi:fasciclin domain-containing protein [Lasiosphaeria hispida]|uniref:Fasciclin domain-containing protein n=1 Tax=Lasiosphaeria hispida TaxID=260671 RepID=A0AAJ0HV73_9PEZI|nr:fasciclin domain-containing protein [Lasiosphaeria hispida]
MKLFTFLFSAAAASAFVTPSGGIYRQAVLNTENENEVQSASQAWWDGITNGEAIFFPVVRNLADSIESSVDGALDAISRYLGDDEDSDSSDGDSDDDGDDGDHHGRHGHHGNASKTIYELIAESKYTKRFAELIEEYDDIKELLQDTKANHTLFVPTDSAFERIPHDHKKPPKEFIQAVLEYHLAPGLFPTRRVLFSHTVPTELKLASLGGHRQRLRIGVSLFGVRINFYGKLVATDIIAKNGLIHAVDAILVPPPRQGKIIQLLPNTFSTFSLALETTGLGEDLADLEWFGGTVFAPTNSAFTKLGRRANAFLFSEHGKKYLRALLKYSIVANETLYSDAFYKRGSGHHDHNDKVESVSDYWHVDLPSLLDEKAIGVDIRRWKRFISILVNGRVHVTIQDGVAADGVVQVVDTVLIPPRHPHNPGADKEDGEISVDELKERLAAYVDDSSEGGHSADL